ncbi:MAG: DEAD/DEAH box helicase [Chitinispirillaceae bacterium]
MMEKFKDLGLTDKTLKAVDSRGFEEPTEIQSLVVPFLLNDENTDLIAQAQTGTGKTAAFALPLIELVDPSVKDVQAIILAPTRELVLQVCEEINSLKGNRSIVVAPIYGGQSIGLQLSKLRKGVTIVVGTPGRVIDHIERGTLKLQNVNYCVLDEGDEMLNMGFVEEIEKILSNTPDTRRTLLFSATMPDRIKKLASRYMKDVKHIKTKTALTTGLTDQIYFEVAPNDRFEALCRIVDMENEFYGIVFCRMKTEVDELVSHLITRGYAADGLHGDISQAQREQILKKFRGKQISMLVATDVAARGIDVNNLTHVINYGLPQDPESYVHRIGRTGRAGNQGTAITFITPREFSRLGFIKRTVNASIHKREVPEVSQIIEQKMQRLTNEIIEAGESVEGTMFEVWARELLSSCADQEQLLASVLKNSYGRLLDKNSYRQLTPVFHKKERRSNFIAEGKTRLFIAMGRNNKTTKKLLVDFIVKEAGISKKLIEGIEIHDRFSFVTVPFAEAEEILAKFKNRRGRQAVVTRAKPMGGGSRQSRFGRKVKKKTARS